MPAPPAITTVELGELAQGQEPKALVFYISEQDGKLNTIKYFSGTTEYKKIDQDTQYGSPKQLVFKNYQGEQEAVGVSDGYNEIAAVAYSDGQGKKQLRVYYVGKNPEKTKKTLNVIREIASEDGGESWFEGSLAHKQPSTPATGSGLSANVFSAGNQLRVYFINDATDSLAVLYMPTKSEGDTQAKTVNWDNVLHLHDNKDGW